MRGVTKWQNQKVKVKTVGARSVNGEKKIN